ncbi:uncharacterized protein SPSK_08871 [Sporothrix schenckii 1099-18]|uniref:Defects in morphology protein 1 n=1 Tax=Sporothrix schenckii 1099-18 TaxID=1397361 RepID=A0A0F2M3R8_SPOSC|nr:uncharacterized protein SPSK_08871 [Sporothrix schenckii 1099-18]KJR84317.1 hypothetical protein SPSK_08871 [Sporothrix schenckii 1099-18]
MPVAGNDSNGKKVGDTVDVDIDSESESDYGWDLSLEEDVHKLLNATAAQTDIALASSSPRARLFVPVVADTPAQHNATASQPLGPLAAEAVGATAAPHHDPVADDDDPSAAAVLDAARVGLDVEYPDLSQVVADLDGEMADGDEAVVGIAMNRGNTDETGPLPPRPAAVPTGIPANLASASIASPLAQFRTYPKKPLSVSDLTAGAWCELQYEYTLTRLPGGRRTRTPAMRAGSKVHQKLEDEVHTTVPITVKKPQDVLGVKIWNMVHGLRTLRETGLTRELDIWGLVDVSPPPVDGQSQQEVVNGVIDALSYENPDPAEQPPRQNGQDNGTPTRRTRRSKSAATATSIESSAAHITDYFPSSPLDPLSQEQAKSSPRKEKEPPSSPLRKVYITDVKTRESTRLPTGAAARPSKIQLYLYHRFLCDLASGNFRFEVVFQRYNVDQHDLFSDDFLAEMYADPLFVELTEDAAADDAESSNTLHDFVRILQHEVALTFPHGAASVGDVVAVEYRQRPRDGDDGGRCIGTNVIPVDENVLDRYLANYLAWWRGARAPVGVDIEEAALKCGYCEFVDDCEWRQTMDEERVQKARAKIAAARGQDN